MKLFKLPTNDFIFNVIMISDDGHELLVVNQDDPMLGGLYLHPDTDGSFRIEFRPGKAGNNWSYTLSTKFLRNNAKLRTIDDCIIYGKTRGPENFKLPDNLLGFKFLNIEHAAAAPFVNTSVSLFHENARLHIIIDQSFNVIVHSWSFFVSIRYFDDERGTNHSEEIAYSPPDTIEWLPDDHSVNKKGRTSLPFK